MHPGTYIYIYIHIYIYICEYSERLEKINKYNIKYKKINGE